jgi:hypothetical protein
MVFAGGMSKIERGYPTTDNTFRTTLGNVVAAFDNVGNVFDLEGDFLGSPFEPRMGTIA